MDHADSGAIYVNIGAHLPREMEYELIETFRNLSQQIVWVYGDGDINNFVPDNVMICQSIPNKIALAHKNTAVFVTEDNTIAVKQALHYGVPMLLVPFRNSQVIYFSAYQLKFNCVSENGIKQGRRKIHVVTLF